MPSQSPHRGMTPVVRIVQKQPKRRPLGSSQLPPAKRRISAPAGETDSSQGTSSVASTIPGQNSTPSSSLNNSGMADITQYVTVTPSATQRWSMIAPTTIGTSSCSTPAAGETLQTDSTHRVVSSLAPGIASTPTSLRSLGNLPTPILKTEARATITHALRTQATERNQRQRQWQLQPLAVSTPQSVVSGSRSIHRFGHSEMMRLLFATGRLMELYMWNSQPFKSASDLEMVSDAMRRAVKALAEAPHWQIIEKYWNTAMQQNNIWSIVFEVCTKDILKEACWGDCPRWIFHAQSGTRFKHKSTPLKLIFFNHVVQWRVLE